MSFFFILRWCILAAEMLIAIPILYLLILSASAILFTYKHKKKEEGSAPLEVSSVNFAILIPAHNEEALLGNLLESLSMQNYPKSQYTVYVVADNCTDNTIQVARSVGWVKVYERFDTTKRSKGYALKWILEQLKAAKLIHDAYVIFDADAVVEPNFLRVMARELAQGTQALQGRSDVANPTESPGTILRWLSLTLINHIRPFGRSSLGFSSRLTGNGMCFTHALLERCPWQTFAHSEDHEYSLLLAQRGERVCYVTDAVVCSHMPPTFSEMKTQDIRWESGFILNYHTWQTALGLLKAGLLLRSAVCFETLLEVFTPPLSLMVSWCFFALVLSLFVHSWLTVSFSLMLIGGLICYVGTAFYLLRPPLRVYRVLLLYAPRFILWKLWVILVLKWRKKHKTEWIRTARPNSAESHS